MQTWEIVLERGPNLDPLEREQKGVGDGVRETAPATQLDHCLLWNRPRSTRSRLRAYEGPRAERVRPFILQHVDFEISEHVCDEIYFAIGELWFEMGPGDYLIEDDFVRRLRGLRKSGIVLGRARIERIARLAFEAFARDGLLVKAAR